MRLLIVDDMTLVRSLIQRALAGESSIKIVAAVSSGESALKILESEKVDLVFLDLEMFGMSGLELIKRMRDRSYQARVIVFASKNPVETDTALRALREGADDFITKPSLQELAGPTIVEQLKSILLPKILQFDKYRRAGHMVVPSNIRSRIFDPRHSAPSIIIIGASTGGPHAIETMLSNLHGPLPCPIVIVQHMPAVFTKNFATQIGSMTKISCAEGEHGERLMPGRIYVAPGDSNLVLQPCETRSDDTGLYERVAMISLDRVHTRHSVRPSVDMCLESAAEVYGKRVLGFILTGMGEDGLEGAKTVRRKGGRILIQTPETCVVFGMPGAVHAAQAYDAIGDPTELGRALFELFQHVGKKAKAA